MHRTAHRYSRRPRASQGKRVYFGDMHTLDLRTYEWSAGTSLLETTGWECMAHSCVCVAAGVNISLKGEWLLVYGGLTTRWRRMTGPGPTAVEVPMVSSLLISAGDHNGAHSRPAQQDRFSCALRLQEFQ